MVSKLSWKSKSVCHCECTCILNEIYTASWGFCTIFLVTFIIEWSGQILMTVFWIGPVLVKCKWFLQYLRLTCTFSLNSCIKKHQWHIYLCQLWLLCLNLGNMDSNLIVPGLQSAFCILNKSLTVVTFWVGFVLVQKPPAFFIMLTFRKYHYWWQDVFPSIKQSSNIRL